MKILTVDINKLVPDPDNARTHDDRNISAIEGSLHEFGQQKPIVIDGENRVIAGNGTLAAAQKMGWEKIQAVRTKLIGDEARAFALADNRTAELAAWDDQILKVQLGELVKVSFDIEAIGFDMPEGEGGEGNAGLTDPDEVPEVPQNVFGVKRGDIWELGGHRLMCGDSTDKGDVDRLMGGVKADMVFTDPPYGVAYEGGHHKLTGQKPRRMIDNDDKDLYGEVIPMIARVCDGPCYTWYAASKEKSLYNAIDKVGQYHAMIVWHKTNATYAALNAHYKQRHEPCVYWKPKGSNLRWCGPTDERTVWEMKRDPKNDLHPTQKPVELAERAISNHKAELVLDLFLGSGSTLIACEKTGRKCYGMEIDPHYCSVILKRWQEFTGMEAKRIAEGESKEESSAQAGE